jgi:uncharacterized protein YbaP (TraB family)
MKALNIKLYLGKVFCLSLSFILVMLPLLVIACGAPEKETYETGNEKVFAWQISSETGMAFLMGSIHVASDDIYPLDSSIEEAYEKADNLVVEVDISDVDPLTTTQMLIKYGAYPEGESLKNNLSNDLYRSVSELFGDLGISVLMIDRFRPWVISMLIEELQLEEMGYSTEYGIDMYFIEKAKEDMKNIIELETAEFQLELFSSFSDKLMIAILQDLFDNPPTQEDIDGLFDAWNNGDSTAMEYLIFEEIDEHPEFEPYFTAIYNERNYNMVDKIEGFLDDNEVYFIIVGAAHLVGEEGLINILESKSYNIVQLIKRD